MTNITPIDEAAYRIRALRQADPEQREALGEILDAHARAQYHVTGALEDLEVMLDPRRMDALDVESRARIQTAFRRMGDVKGDLEVCSELIYAEKPPRITGV